MLFSVPANVSGASFNGVSYPASGGFLTVPDSQVSADLTIGFALRGIVAVSGSSNNSGSSSSGSTTFPSGTPGYDPTAARLTDVPTIQLGAAPYNAPLDGVSHMMTQAAALLAYPNCGAAGPIEHDTAAWLQCEYDIRTSVVRTRAIIGLFDFSTMMVSQQLVLQDASRVAFYGGHHVTLHTAQCGTTAAVSLLNCPNVCVVLRDLMFLAQATPVGTGNTGGATWHGYSVGASAIYMQNVQGINIERVGWNGYDRPLTWGDKVYGIIFDDCGGSGNNFGFSWFQTTGLDSMERIYFKNGSLANNNYGFYVDTTYGGDSNGLNKGSQGGSIFIQDSAIDYNLVRHGVYISTPAGSTYAGSSLHITGCHLETTGANSGTALARILSQGEINLSNNECYENDSGIVVAFVEVADGTGATVTNNIFTASTLMPICYSTTAADKRVEGSGNIFHDASRRPILLKDANGVVYQPSVSDGCAEVVVEDFISSDFAYYQYAWFSRLYKREVLCDYLQDGNFTLPAREVIQYRPGDCIRFWNAGVHTVTFVVQAGPGITASLTSKTGKYKLAPGATAIARMTDTAGQWQLGGMLT